MPQGDLLRTPPFPEIRGKYDVKGLHAQNLNLIFCYRQVRAGATDI